MRRWQRDSSGGKENYSGDYQDKSWNELYNQDFNRVQFEAVRSETGLNRGIRKIRITVTD